MPSCWRVERKGTYQSLVSSSANLSLPLTLRGYLDPTTEKSIVEKLVNQFNLRTGTINWWLRGSSDSVGRPYPDDHDDTAVALASLYPSEVSKILPRWLKALEKSRRNDGTYTTWLYPQWQDTDAVVQLNIARALLRHGYYHEWLWKWIANTYLSAAGKSRFYTEKWLPAYWWWLWVNDHWSQATMRLKNPSLQKQLLDVAQNTWQELSDPNLGEIIIRLLTNQTTNWRDQKNIRDALNSQSVNLPICADYVHNQPSRFFAVPEFARLLCTASLNRYKQPQTKTCADHALSYFCYEQPSNNCRFLMLLHQACFQIATNKAKPNQYKSLIAQLPIRIRKEGIYYWRSSLTTDLPITLRWLRNLGRTLTLSLMAEKLSPHERKLLNKARHCEARLAQVADDLRDWHIDKKNNKGTDCSGINNPAELTKWGKSKLKAPLKTARAIRTQSHVKWLQIYAGSIIDKYQPLLDSLEGKNAAK